MSSKPQKKSRSDQQMHRVKCNNTEILKLVVMPWIPVLYIYVVMEQSLNAVDNCLFSVITHVHLIDYQASHQWQTARCYLG
jgi:hypothetical protein